MNAEPSFVRRSIAKLARAGLVSTTRGKYGACSLARGLAEITLLDIYRACGAPPAACGHSYAVQPACPVSSHIQPCMSGMLHEAQAGFEETLARRTLGDLVEAVRAREDADAPARPGRSARTSARRFFRHHMKSFSVRSAAHCAAHS